VWESLNHSKIKPFTFALLFALTICQEIDPRTGASGLMVLGNQIFFSKFFGLPPLFLLVFTAALSIVLSPKASAKLFNSNWQRSSFACCWALGTLALGITLSENGISSAGIATATLPYLLFAGGQIVGSTLDSKLLELAVLTTNLLLAVAGVFVFAVTKNSFIYYDSATSVIGVLGVFWSSQSRKGRTFKTLLALASLGVLFFSARRTILICATLAVAVAWGVSKGFRKRAPLLVIPFLVAGLAIVATPTNFGQRLASLYAFAQGAGDDYSAITRISDLQIGWSYFITRPFGYGPFQSQLPGLIAKSELIYVHNQVLQSLLVWGVLGGLLVGLQFGVIALSRIRYFLHGDLSNPANLAVSLALITAVFSMSASPFFTQTYRWPVMVGLLLGFGLQNDFRGKQLT
jgi:O-antigen ligase